MCVRDLNLSKEVPSNGPKMQFNLRHLIGQVIEKGYWIHNIEQFLLDPVFINWAQQIQASQSTIPELVDTLKFSPLEVTLTAGLDTLREHA